MPYPGSLVSVVFRLVTDAWVVPLEYSGNFYLTRLSLVSAGVQAQSYVIEDPFFPLCTQYRAQRSPVLVKGSVRSANLLSTQQGVVQPLRLWSSIGGTVELLVVLEITPSHGIFQRHHRVFSPQYVINNPRACMKGNGIHSGSE
jgi:hypothetical protein